MVTTWNTIGGEPCKVLTLTYYPVEKRFSALIAHAIDQDTDRNYLRDVSARRARVILKGIISHRNAPRHGRECTVRHDWHKISNAAAPRYSAVTFFIYGNINSYPNVDIDPRDQW